MTKERIMHAIVLALAVVLILSLPFLLSAISDITDVSLTRLGKAADVISSIFVGVAVLVLAAGTLPLVAKFVTSRTSK